MPRGGRRPGAGAPRGNKNAVRTGQSSNDPAFRAFLQSLTSEQLDLAGGSPRAAWLGATGQVPREDFSEKVRPLHGGPSLPNPQPPVVDQSNTRRLRAVVDRLRDLHLMGAEPFVRDHWPHISMIESILDDLDQMQEAGTLIGVTSPAALFRSTFHETVKRETNDYIFCPHCSWRREREPGARVERSALG